DLRSGGWPKVHRCDPAFAPSGGAGNRTSMRGGGPLTAVVVPVNTDPDRPTSLWRRLWANVQLRDAALPEPEKIFSWLRPTLTSGKADGGAELHDADSRLDPLHAFFGMPRRLWLTFAGEGVCAMTGEKGPVAIGFVQKPWGMNYGLWQHPLTPYRREKKDGVLYSMKPKSGRFGYRDWVAATIGDSPDGPLRQGAAAVHTARQARADELCIAGARDPLVRVAGWAMNNMEAVSYLAADTPMHLAAHGQAVVIDTLARRLADAGDLAASALRSAVGRVLSRDAAPDKTAVAQVSSDFFGGTDDTFHDLLDAALNGAGDPEAQWLATLRQAALALFDTAAPAPADDAQRAADVVESRSGLVATFSGYGPLGRKLFGALALPPPETKRGKGRVA
ncbi:MAG: type I-E CRISPR-associated protein Cse1/CasA, partial [Gammaproteobacteria bacterium]